MALKRLDHKHKNSVRYYDCEIQDVPNMLRQIANELETADKEALEDDKPGTYLASIVDQGPRGMNVSTFIVVLEHDS